MDIKISIVTAVFNSEDYIEKTIESVKNQSYLNREHIIIDGGSTDSTVDIIKRHGEDIYYWVSEPDKGIADAMNKGIKLATGDYVLFLNSDDYLLNSHVLDMVTKLMIDQLDIYIFKVNFLYNDGRQTTSLNHRLGTLTNFKMGSCHQGQFISRRLLLKLQRLDANLKINFDYDFILRAYRSGATSRSFNEVVSVMRQVGISSRRDWHGFRERYDEERLVHYKNCESKSMFIIYKIYWTLYMPYRLFRYGLIYLNKKYIKNKTIKVLQ